MEEPRRFRHKALEVLGWRLESPQDPERIFNWLRNSGLVVRGESSSKGNMRLDLADGTLLDVTLGEWVIRYDNVVISMTDENLWELYSRVDEETGDHPISVEWPKDEGDILVFGPELFVYKDLSVLSWQGQEYLKPCGLFVKGLEDGGQTFCVKPVNHASHTHEDMHGNTKLEYTTLKEGRIQHISLEPEVDPAHGVHPIEILKPE